MKQVINLNDEGRKLDSSLDTITIVKCLELIPGGKVLDVTGYKPETIKAGHIIIFNNQEGTYKPMPVAENGKEYADLPENCKPVGVLYRSVLTANPLVSVMVRGTVNQVTMPYSMKERFDEYLPLIRFTQD